MPLGAFVPTGPLIPTDIFDDGPAGDDTNPLDRDSVLDQLLDAGLQRPEEVGLGSEDDVDLPFGSLRSPLGDPDFEGSRAFGGRIVILAVLAVVGFVFLQAFASGVGEGVVS